MQIDNLINTTIPALRPTDHAEDALARLEDSPLTQLPVIDEDNQYKGILSEEILYHATLVDNPKVSEIEPIFVDNYAFTHQHLFEGLRLTKDGMDFIPVTDEFQTLVGVVPLSDIAQSLAHTHTVQKIGAVVVLSIKERDYSLAQLSRLAETHNIKILGVLTEKHTQKSDSMMVTIKLDQVEIMHFTATLERFDYNIVGVYAEDDSRAYDKKRLDLLLKYIEI